MIVMPHWPIYTGTIKSIDNSKVKRILSILGNPEASLQNIFHVGGTNGKGSVCAFIKSILVQAGYRVNTYTSPHLLAYNERINLNGLDISDNEAFCYTESVRYVSEKRDIDLTIFEATTIVAMLAFAESKADFNIIEVGMGGVNDATNIFAARQISACILHTVGYDHTKYLGTTLHEIALHKSGILRQDVPCIIAPQMAESMESILNYCNQNSIGRVYAWGRDYFCEKIAIDSGEGVLGDGLPEYVFEYVYRNNEEVYFPLPSLIGDHQILNAGIAITAIKAADLEINDDIIATAIQNTKWRGRLERIVKSKFLSLLPIGSEIWFDGAHNPDGAGVLSSWIVGRDIQNNLPNYVIIGKTRDSDSINFVSKFGNIVNRIYAVKVNGEILPEHPEVIYNACISQRIACDMAKNLLDAVVKIAKLSHLPVRIVICGSLYLMRDIESCKA